MAGALGGVALAGGAMLALQLPAQRSEVLSVGARAGALRLRERPGDLALQARVELAEIAGSDTFVHVHSPVGELVAQVTGVHNFSLGEALTLYLDPAQTFVFGDDGGLLVAPRRS
jgi:glycerol transport system ATP-binding protein